MFPDCRGVRLAGGWPGGTIEGDEPVTGRPRRRRRRQCRWRAGPAKSGPVVTHGGAWVGVGGGFLHVAERDPGVQCRGDEGVPERVRPDGLGDPGAASDPVEDPPGAMPVQPPPLCGQEDGSFAALADGQVDCPRRARGERDGDYFPALAGDHQGTVAALDADRLNVGVRSLRYA